jgi:hypothetical protein
MRRVLSPAISHSGDRHQSQCSRIRERLLGEGLVELGELGRDSF